MKAGRGFARFCLACVLATAAGTPGWSQDSPSEPSAETITVEAQMTRFVFRRSLSADRVGVLSETPQEGDQVRAGAIIARLRDDVPRAVLAAAEATAASMAEINAAETLYESERLEYEVMAEANANAERRPPYPNSDVQRARLRSESAKLQIAVKQHEQEVNGLLRDQAQAELRTHHVVAPIDGIVTRVFKHAGEGVQQAEAILEIANTRRLRVEGRIPAEAAWRIHPGTKVLVRFPNQGDEGQGREVAATLGFVDVSADGVGQERRVRIWVDVDNPGDLRDGMPATMIIAVDEETKEQPAAAR